MVEKLMTKKEVAEYLQVSERTIDNFREKGMPCAKIGKVIRFDREKVLEWFNGQNE